MINNGARVKLNMKAILEERMQHVLDRLGIRLQAVWTPKANKDKHGEIILGDLYVYDKDESEAWLTFEHEIYEYEFNGISYVYRSLVNSLIECFEKIAYERKERFLNVLPRIQAIISEEKGLQ